MGVAVDDPDVLEGYRFDRTPSAPAGTPTALVRARTESEITTTLRIASRLGVPVVPRGAGSGLAGGANAIDGCVVLCTEQMSSVLELDTDQRLAVVEPGLLNADLKRAAAEHGLWYPPDPASAEFCSIGGNVATNSGGLCCVKYGVTRDWVLGLRVALSNGQVIETGAPTRKNVTGLDMTGLFVGSEGALGVVTQATLRLCPAFAPASTMAAYFPHLKSAGEAVSAIRATGVTPSLLEVLDQATLVAIESFRRSDLDTDAAALLLGQSNEPGELRRHEVAAMAEAARGAGAHDVFVTDDPAEGEMFLDVRRMAIPSLELAGTTLLDDVSVPVNRLTEMIAAIAEIADRHVVRVVTFGHAGDGNLHPTFVYDEDDHEETDRVEAAFAEMVSRAVELGGSITGEHGVGTLKLDYFADQVGEASVELQNGIRELLDPAGIMNPGKAIGRRRPR